MDESIRSIAASTRLHTPSSKDSTLSLMMAPSGMTFSLEPACNGAQRARDDGNDVARRWSLWIAPTDCWRGERGACRAAGGDRTLDVQAAREDRPRRAQLMVRKAGQCSPIFPPDLAAGGMRVARLTA